MLTNNLIDFVNILNISDLSTKDCQRCLNMYNNDVRKLIHSNADNCIGDDCITLIENVKTIIPDNNELFSRVYDQYMKECYWDAHIDVMKSPSKNKNSSNAFENWIVASKQLATYCLITVLESTHQDAIFCAMECLLKLCTLSGASAYGINNLNVLSVVSATVGRYVHYTIISPTERNVEMLIANSSDDEVSSVCDEADEEKVGTTAVATRRSRRVAALPQSQSNDKKNGSKDAQLATFGKHWLDSVCPRLIHLLSLFNIKPAEGGVNPFVHIYLSKRGHMEAMLDSLFDCLILLATAPTALIVSEKEEKNGNHCFMDLSELCHSVIEQFVLPLEGFEVDDYENANYYLSFVHLLRAMMPFLTLSNSTSLRMLLPVHATNHMISKSKSIQHTNAVNLLLTLIKNGCAHQQLLSSALYDVETNLDVSVEDDACEDVAGVAREEGFVNDDISTVSPTKSPVRPSKRTHAPYPWVLLCMIGCVQRIILKFGSDSKTKFPNSTSATGGASGTNPLSSSTTKSLMLTTLTQLINCMMGLLEQHAPKDSPLLTNFMLFLMKITRSNKISVRMFAIDVIAACLSSSNSWLWENQQPTIDLDDPLTVIKIRQLKSFQYDFATAIYARLRDVSASVRLRSINAFFDMLSVTPSDNCNVLWNEFIYCVVSGDAYVPMAPVNTGNGIETAKQKSICLMEALKFLCLDLENQSKSSLVKSKALNLFGLCLSRSYLTNGTNTNLLIASEDIDIFIQSLTNTATLSIHGESNVLVKKQVIHSLTQLVISRPFNEEIQDAWLLHALPMVYDNEAAVVTAVLKDIFELYCVPLVRWFNQKVGGSSEGKSEQVDWCWSFFHRTGVLDRVKIFRHGLGLLLQQGLLSSGSYTSSQLDSDIRSHRNGMELSVTLSSMLLALKEVSNEPKASQDGAPTDLEFEIDFQSRQPIVWMFLESLLSYDHLQLVINNQPQINVVSGMLNKISKLTSASGKESDFILSNWLKYSNNVVENNITCINSEYMLLLNILTRVCSNDNCSYSNEELLKIFNQIQSLITSIPVLNTYSDAHGTGNGNYVSVMINLMYVLTIKMNMVSGGGAGNSTSDTDKIISAMYKGVLKWVNALLTPCVDLLKSYFHQSDANLSVSSDLREQQLRTVLVIIGEIALLGFNMTEEEEHFKPGPAPNEVARAHAWYSVSDINKSIRINISADVMQYVLLCIGHTMPNASGGSKAVHIPDVTRALAIITLGKCCMRSKALSRNNLNILLREVQLPDASTNASTSPGDATSGFYSTAATRGNALIVLGDMCIRYTNVIEGHIPTISVTLQDSDIQIRKQAFILFIQLLLQDYIKLKGILLYRLFVCSIDPDLEFMEFAREILSNTLLQKYPNYVVSHFIELVVILNKCSLHPSYSNYYIASCYSETDQERVKLNVDGTSDVDASTSTTATELDLGASIGLTLDGHTEKSQNYRYRIYTFLLHTLTEEQKIHVTARLVQDVLSYSIDHSAQLFTKSVSLKTRDQKNMENTLSDVLMILQSPLLCIGNCVDKSNSGGIAEEIDDEDVNNHAAVHQLMNKAKSKVLKQVAKQHMVDTILPVLATLKHLLEEFKSPLQKICVQYFCVLLKMYKVEMDEALSHDPILKSELEYDLRIFEQAQQEQLLRQQMLNRRKEMLQAEETAMMALQEQFLDDTLASTRTPIEKDTTLAAGSNANTTPCKLRFLSNSATNSKSDGLLNMSSANGTKTPSMKPRNSIGAASTNMRHSLGSRPGSYNVSPCPPTLKKGLLTCSNTNSKSSTPKILSNAKISHLHAHSTLTPNSLLKAVGSALRVKDSTPYGVCLDEQTERADDTLHLSRSSASNPGYDLELGGELGVDTELESPLGLVGLDVDLDMHLATKRDSFAKLQSTSTRRLSWNVDVGMLNDSDRETDRAAPSGKDEASVHPKRLNRKRKAAPVSADNQKPVRTANEDATVPTNPDGRSGRRTRNRTNATTNSLMNC